jgi:hypothetical protein
MIAAADGEVSFSDGLVIRPHAPIASLPLEPRIMGRSALGWVYFDAGRHRSEHGEFSVELACSEQDSLAIFLVVLCSVNPFFEIASDEDRERAAFHEAVLARDLRGQREFSWGEAFCKYNRQDARNCLNIVYTAGPKVPRRITMVPGARSEHGVPENFSS